MTYRGLLAVASVAAAGNPQAAYAAGDARSHYAPDDEHALSLDEGNAAASGYCEHPDRRGDGSLCEFLARVQTRIQKADPHPDGTLASAAFRLRGPLG
jgi:hypothetical protein